MVHIETKETISNSFPRGHGDNDEIICKHKMVEISWKAAAKPKDKIER